MAERDPLVVIDRVMARLEEMERHVARLEGVLRECGSGRGVAYQLYRVLVETEELVRELRRIVFEECTCGER